MLSSRIRSQSLRALCVKPSLGASCILPRHFSSTPQSQSSILDVIRNDHRGLEQAYKKIVDSKTIPDKVRWQNQFTWAVACHSIGEEMVVYPAMDKNVDNGRNMADHDRVEHHIVKEHLYRFQNLEPNDPDFINTLDVLWAHLRQHIQHEENHDLPTLEKSMSQGEIDSLVTQFRRTKKFTPTRSHPDAPDKPPFETVAGLMTAPMDRLMDIFRHWPEKEGLGGKQQTAGK